MGDHRAHIKIEMSFHGIERKMDSYPNWFPDEWWGIDENMREFFVDIYSRGMAKYNDEMAEADAIVRKDEIEAEEKRELRRLQAKYTD